MKLYIIILRIACIAALMGCSQVISNEDKVRQLYEHLDSCSHINEGFVPPYPYPKIELANAKCIKLISDRKLYWKKSKADSIRSRINCHLLLKESIYTIGSIPHIHDTCYWRPTSCSIKKETNFPDQYLFLKRNTRTSWEQSKTMRLYDRSKYAYEWYCKLVPFPCVDSTFLDKVKGKSIEIICFHDYTHCYLIGADSIPRYIDQVRPMQ